jgi:hypothetical protein
MYPDGGIVRQTITINHILSSATLIFSFVAVPFPRIRRSISRIPRGPIHPPRPRPRLQWRPRHLHQRPTLRRRCQPHLARKGQGHGRWMGDEEVPRTIGQEWPVERAGQGRLDNREAVGVSSSSSHPFFLFCCSCLGKFG